jgi:energy-coupling factor transport system ATP-binding protein
VLSLEHASYRHAGAQGDSLHDVWLEMLEGSLAGLQGPSGAGLSTLCLVLGGLAPRVVRGHLRGNLLVDGADASGWPMHRLAERVVTGLGLPSAQLSMVAETVFEEVAVGPANLGLARDDVLARTWASLESLAIADLATRDPRHLSGGEQQLVVLAGLLAVGARHVVLDGPLAHLHPEGRERLFGILGAEAARGRAILVTDHRADTLTEGCDRVLHIASGRLVDESPPVSLPAAVPAVQVGELVAAPDIVIDGMSHTYATGVRGLDGIDLRIEGGESLAIVGPNGSGKTTLARHLDGLLRPTSGRVLIRGADAARIPVATLARTVALGFQDPERQIFARSVATEVAFGPRQARRDRAAVARAVESALAAVGLEDAADVHPADLGESRRKLLTIASLLAMECPVLVLDEPTAGLDDTGVAIVSRIVGEQHALGRTVIAISHDRSFVAGSFGRVVCVERGRVVADGSPETVLRDPHGHAPKPVGSKPRPPRNPRAT